MATPPPPPKLKSILKTSSRAASETHFVDPSPAPRKRRLTTTAQPLPKRKKSLTPSDFIDVRRRSTSPRRQFSLYEAVAGRISVAGRMPSLSALREARESLNARGRTFSRHGALAKAMQTQTASVRDTLTRSTRSLPAAEVLFSRSAAPARYAEPAADVYGASRWLEGRTTRREDVDGSAGKERMRVKRLETLPRSDLLKAVHAYAARFYGAMRDGSVDVGSLDESALLAVGILLEEMCVAATQDGSWRAFVEQADSGEEKSWMGGWESDHVKDEIDGTEESEEEREVDSAEDTQDDDTDSDTNKRAHSPREDGSEDISEKSSEQRRSEGSTDTDSSHDSASDSLQHDSEASVDYRAQQIAQWGDDY